jgi:hypothetical protein
MPNNITTIRRRPGQQPASLPGAASPVNIKKFNEGLRYVQGFRQALASASTTPITITLNAAGKRLLGFSVIPVSGTNSDISDCQVNIIVNNNNVLLNAGLQNLNPNFVQNMIFFPTPQPLTGKDTINFNVNKNNSGAVTIIINCFYVPLLG